MVENAETLGYKWRDDVDPEKWLYEHRDDIEDGMSHDAMMTIRTFANEFAMPDVTVLSAHHRE
jgi:hypothetical protein